ncbi:MAG: serine/threonine-protein kinase [Acidobacteria bacterium]|nr:serine/threonine-protein kinase [Acidobacteriota bacterium]
MTSKQWTSKQKWQLLQETFDELEPLSPRERARALALLDPVLAQEVAQLLNAAADEQQAQQRLKRPPDPDPPRPELPGLRVLEPIGSGGSGVVYRAIRTVEGAEQGVAVKVLHKAFIDEDDLRRFARERQMMATLNHPGVVHFLDAGATGDGRPYLVMELAEGSPIQVYCNQHRLRVEDRIRLLMQVCQAVAAAHARLIVHLDLKPSNILVSETGVVKLLDLGTARLLNPRHDATVTLQLTPQYASPEQLRSQPPAVSSDVYSLGVILYELLSGGWPFLSRDSIVAIADRAAGNARVRDLAETATPEAAQERSTTASRLRATLEGDLSLICQKALAFDPAERYQTVGELAEDLRRHLDGEPVLAHPPRLAYRVGKFAVRYRAQLLLVVLVVAGLAGSAVYSARQLGRTLVALGQADASRLAMAAALGSNDVSAKPNVTLLEFLRQTHRNARLYVPDEPAIRSDFEAALSAGFLAQNDLPSAGQAADQALQFARQARDVRREAAALVSASSVSFRSGRMDQGFGEASRGFGLWKENRSEFTPVQSWSLLSTAGAMLLYTRPFDRAAAEVFSACLAEAAAGNPAAEPYRADCLYGQGMVALSVTAKYSEAIQMLREAVTYWRARNRPQALSRTLQGLGLAYRNSGLYAQDEACQREAAEIQTASAGLDSLISANYRAVWASALAATGHADQGLREAVNALAIYRKIYAKRGDPLLWTPLSAAAANAYALGHYEDSIAYAQEGLEALGPASASRDPRRCMANSYLGLSLARLRRDAEAMPLLEQALRDYEALHRQHPKMDDMRSELARLQQPTLPPR